VLAVAATLVAISPVLVVIVTRTGRDHVLVSDPAIIDLRVRDVWSVDVPLVGVYSRYGWNHPGPAMFWALAPFSLVARGAAWGTLVGSAVLQGVAIVACAQVAWRLGRLALTLVVLSAVSLAYAAFGAWFFLEPWNPYLAFPFFALLLLEAWAIATGARWQLVAIAATGSLLVQVHVGYLPLVVAAIAWASALIVPELVRDPARRRAWAYPALIAAVTAIAFWIPPLVGEVVDEPSNFRRLLEFWTGEPPEETVGLTTGIGILAAEYRILPPWLGGPDLVAPLFFAPAAAAPIAWMLVPLVLLGTAVFVSRGDPRLRDDRRLLGLVAIVNIAGIVAISRITGPPYAHLMYWRVTIATLTIAAAVWVFWRRYLETRPAARTIGVAAAATCLAFGSGSLAVDVATYDRDIDASRTTTEVLVDQISKSEFPTKPVLIRGTGSWFQNVPNGVVNELDGRGAPVNVDEEYGFIFGESRAASTENVNEVWYVTESGAILSVLTSLPGATLIATSTPLDSRAERRITDLQRDLAGDLERLEAYDRLGALDSSSVNTDLADLPDLNRRELDELADLNARVLEAGSCRCGVVAYPPDLAPSMHPAVAT
jgi:hypothetical protein